MIDAAEAYRIKQEAAAENALQGKLNAERTAKAEQDLIANLTRTEEWNSGRADRHKRRQ